MTETAQLMRLAAPAPHDEDELPEQSEGDREIDDLCERWIVWTHKRRLYGPRPLTSHVLGRLRAPTRPVREDAGDAVISAPLSAFHIAYTCQPDALDKRVFDLYYVHRVKPIKSAADALGIGRPHFYRLLGEFRRRVYMASKAILAANMDEATTLLGRRA